MAEIADEAVRIETHVGDDAIVSALNQAYAHATTHIAEFAKLQYQLVAIAYGLAGAAIAFFATGTNQALGSQTGLQVEGTFILFLPPIFYAISFVQIYLHAQIKRYGRYVNFDLRPKMEALIQVRLGIKDELGVPFWNWEDIYVENNPESRLAKVHSVSVRVLSLIIMVLPLVPAIAAIFLYWAINRDRPFPVLDKAVFMFDGAIAFFAVLLIGMIGWVNMKDLNKQSENRAEDIRKHAVEQFGGKTRHTDANNGGADNIESGAVDAFIKFERDPTMIALVIDLTDNPRNKNKLRRHLIKLKTEALSAEAKSGEESAD